jgi:hypothetical protein
MYKLVIPENRPIVINILDKIMDGSTVHVPDANTCRIFGRYVKSWHRNGFIGIYNDLLLKDTVIKFNIKKVEKHIGIGKRIEYIVDDSFLKTSIYIPKI